MPTTTKSRSSGGSPPCKKCGKATRTDAAGKLQHERRGDPSVVGGRRADPNAKQKSGASGDEEPDREHGLSRKLFGKKED